MEIHIGDRVAEIELVSFIDLPFSRKPFSAEKERVRIPKGTDILSYSFPSEERDTSAV